MDQIYREAQALKRLSHPNIIKLYHAFLWKNFVVLIMENVAGGELLKYVNEKGAGEGLPEKEARDFFVQLTEAVEYCHNKSIIHRDLKPENILLTDPTSKVIKVYSISKRTIADRLRDRGEHLQQEEGVVRSGVAALYGARGAVGHRSRG